MTDAPAIAGALIDPLSDCWLPSSATAQRERGYSETEQAETIERYVRLGIR